MKQSDVDELKEKVAQIARQTKKVQTSPRSKNGLVTVRVIPAFDGRKLSMDERKQATREISDTHSPY